MPSSALYVRFRAYPGLEFVVANTLAKRIELMPNVINLSQKVVSNSCFVFNPLPSMGDFCCLLITFASSLDLDQAQQNVGPDLDPKLFDTWMVLDKSSIQRVKYGTVMKCGQWNNKSNI